MIEKLITKDYEHYMEFISQEDLFCDKLVNLQNPYFYLPLSSKQRNDKNCGNNQNIINYTREKHEFFNKISSKFQESNHSKPTINSKNKK